VYSKLHGFHSFLIALALAALAGAPTAQGQMPTPPVQTPTPAAPVSTTATMRGHIADPTGALIPGATITILSSTGTTVKTATADASGGYVVNGLAPGGYIVRATFAGFARFTSPVIQLTAGQMKRVDISMALEVAQQSVTVTDESPTVNVEASGNSNAIVLKGKDLEALSDDPDELSNELTALAGPSAGPNGGQIYIDGFTGGQLPPKSAIREIRINQNPFSAEFDRLGYGRIEILTKPGTDKLHGRFFGQGNDDVFNTGNPFTGALPSYHSYQVNGTLNGSLSKTASFFISVEQRNNQNDSVYSLNQAPILDAATNTYSIGPLSGGLFSPQTHTNISPRIDLQLGQKNTLTLRYQFFRNTQSGQIGSTSLPSLASSSTSIENTIQLSDSQIINDHIVNETRFQYLRDTSSTTPVSTAPLISVPGSFTGGGSSSQQSNDHQDHLELQNLTTMSVGRHAIKFGTRLRDNRDANATNAGFNGSFTFNSMADYVGALNLLNGVACPSGTDCAPAKLNYTTGVQGASANVFDAAVFVQDDWKFNPFLTLSGGLRWESQNHISDHSDFAPRFAFAYALDGHKDKKQAKTVLRGGYGFFYDRLGVGNVLSAERFSGAADSQMQFTINTPACFNAASLSTILANPSQCGTATSTTSTIVQIAPSYHSPTTEQLGIGVERQLTKTTTLTLTYLHSFGVHQVVTRDSNAYEPGTFEYGSSTLTGVRPDTNATCLAANDCPGIVNEYYPEAVFKQNQLIANINAKLTPKFGLMGFYNLTSANSDGAGGTASNSYNISQDYGRAPFAARQMLFLMANYTGPWGISFNPFLIAQAGRPFNIVTPYDLSGDNFFNNRPSYTSAASDPANVVQTSYGSFDTVPQAGEAIAPANMATGPAAIAVNLRVSRTFGIGPKLVAAGQNNAGGSPQGGPPPGGGGGRGGPGGGGPGGGLGPGGLGGGGRGGPGGMFGSTSTDRKYSLNFSVQALNLFNDIDYGTPGGTLTMPNFNKSTSLAGGIFSSGAAARRVFVQAAFSF